MITWEQEQARVAEVGKVFDVNARLLQMEVLQDDGLHRHVRFAQPGSGLYRFSLVTWPGHLAVTGDVESFTFARLPDMFEFFGGRRSQINPSYWAEKCVAGRDQLSAYDQDYARQQVIEYFIHRAKSEGVPRGTGRALRWDLLEHEEFAHQEGAHLLLREFAHGTDHVAVCSFPTCKERVRFTDEREDALRWAKNHQAENAGHTVRVSMQDAFRFYDTWEWDLTRWNFHFLYACHAITWGIGKYYARKNMPPRLWAKQGRL